VPYGFDFLTLIPPLCGVVAGVELVGAGLVVVLGAADGVMVDGVVVLGSVVLGVVVLGLVVLGVVVLGVTVVSTGVVVVDGVVVLGDVVDGVTGAVVSTGVRVTLPADESRVTRAVSVVVVGDVAGVVAGVGDGAGVVVGVWAPTKAGAANRAAARAMDFMSDFLRATDGRVVAVQARDASLTLAG
jgi:hypothetical protein